MDPLTHKEIVAENIDSYMQWRGLSNEDLADRLSVIGPDEKTRFSVKRMREGTREIQVSELFPLALALETTVENLLYPHRIARKYDRALDRPPVQIGHLPASDDITDVLRDELSRKEPMTVNAFGVWWQDNVLAEWRQSLDIAAARQHIIEAFALVGYSFSDAADFTFDDFVEVSRILDEKENDNA